MSGPKIKSVKGLFGTTHHYDERGNYLGYSQEGLFGATNHYNASGRNVGYSQDALLGGQNHFDSAGHKVGYSVDTLLGESHYGVDGTRGYTASGLLGTSTSISGPSIFQDDPSDADDFGGLDDFDW